MISKAKALYQVKVILDYLPEDEYKLIPKEMLDYIEDNFEYDEKFSIEPNIPLEKQKIDDKAYEMLDKIVKSAETTKKDFLKISEKSTKEPKIAPSPLPSAPKVAKSEVDELKAFDIQNYLNSISKKAASAIETTAPSGANTLADMQSEPSSESRPSFGDAIENRLSDNNFKDMITALKMQDKIISRDIQQNSVRPCRLLK